MRDKQILGILSLETNNEGYGMIDDIRASMRKRAYDCVEYFCLFIGYPRSGHSAVGAMLNAHQNIVLAHELDAVKFAREGISRDRIFLHIEDRDKWWRKGGWKWEGWDYSIPGLYQGRCDRIAVIGDKAGGLTSRQINHDPHTLDIVADAVGVPLKLIHHIRNPFDTIATMTRKGQPGVENLDEAIERYFAEHVPGVRIAKEQLRADVLDVRHEDLLSDTSRSLRLICAHLGQDADQAYLRACEEFVNPSPTRSRLRIEWTSQQIDRVHRLVGDVPWLRQYSFDL